MQTTRLSKKGQIALPKSIRDSRGWKPGMRFTIEEQPNGILLRPAAEFPRAWLDDVVGCLAYKGKPKTLAQMDAAITAEIKQRHARGRY